jgi:pimeloyl-ACP methyl ester carboxylesterase
MPHEDTRQLAERPSVPELQTVAIPEACRSLFEGDRFCYMEAGPADAPAVLLLHGIGANSWYWRYQLAGLSTQHRVIAWNAPGYILTDLLRKERPTANDYADALASFADALKLTRPVAVVGNSFGSAVALCFSARFPDRVSRLALSGTSVGAKSMPPDEREAVFVRRQKQFEGAGGMTYAKQVTELVLGSRTSPRARAEAYEVMAMTNGRGYLAASHVPFDFDAFELAPRISVPVLIYHGTDDKIAPIERSSICLQEKLPNARLVKFDGYGHLPEVELPDEVNKLLVEFLEAP